MNKKLKIRICIDLLITLLLFGLMARQLIGESVHEWIGAAMFILWIIHHILNRRWYLHLFKGKYTLLRTLQTIINLALLICMLCLMAAAIVLSQEVFAFLPISGGISIARPLHVFCAFWCFTLMSLHLGLYWHMILQMIKQTTGIQCSKKMTYALRTMACLIAVYGVYAIIVNELSSYLFLTSSFVYYDFEKPIVLFFLEYAAIMGLFIFLAYYGSKALTLKRKTKIQ